MQNWSKEAIVFGAYLADAEIGAGGNNRAGEGAQE